MKRKREKGKWVYESKVKSALRCYERKKEVRMCSKLESYLNILYNTTTIQQKNMLKLQYVHCTVVKKCYIPNLAQSFD